MTDIFNKTGSKIKTESSTSRPGSHYKMGSQRGTPQPAEETEEPPVREPTPVPRCSIYMQTIEWLIEVKAVPVSLPNMELFFYYLSLNLPHYFFFFLASLNIFWQLNIFQIRWNCKISQTNLNFYHSYLKHSLTYQIKQVQLNQLSCVHVIYILVIYISSLLRELWPMNCFHQWEVPHLDTTSTMLDWSFKRKNTRRLKIVWMRPYSLITRWHHNFQVYV